MAEDTRFSHLKFLLADDQGIMLDMMRAILRGLNCCDVHIEQNGENVLNTYLDLHPDVIMLDINMPKRNGLEILKEIIHSNSEAFVVIVSAESTVENVQTAIKAGAKGFIAKPYNSKRIEAILNKYLKEHV